MKEVQLTDKTSEVKYSYLRLSPNLGFKKTKLTKGNKEKREITWVSNVQKTSRTQM